MPGKMIGPQALILREDVGEMTDPKGNSYELTTTLPGRAPLIKSKRTGKTFAMSWEDLVRLAIEEGVNEQDTVTV